MGDDGWIMPKNAQEFHERYANRIEAWAKMFGKDQWEDVAQSAWFYIYSPSSRSSYNPGRDKIEFINGSASGWDRLNEYAFLGYVRVMVKKLASTMRYGNDDADAMHHGAWSLSSLVIDEEDERAEAYISDWLFDHRNRYRESMQNSPERVLYLQQFLTFVEREDPELLPYVIAIESAKVSRSGHPNARIYNVGELVGLNPAQSLDHQRRLTALAERWEGKPLSGEAKYHLTRESLPKIQTKRKARSRESRPCPPREELLQLMESQTFAQIGKHYVTDAMQVRDWALSYGVTRRRGKLYELPPEQLRKLLAKRAENRKGQKKKMNISIAGIALIKKFEGFSANVYVDLAGFRTIGYGHKLRADENLTTITEEEAEEILQRDIAVVEGQVRRLVKVPTTQGQFDALVSFVFNLGASRLASSTLLRDLNAGKTDEAGAQLLEWDHAGGREVPGLKARREAERQLWCGSA